MKKIKIFLTAISFISILSIVGCANATNTNTFESKTDIKRVTSEQGAINDAHITNVKNGLHVPSKVYKDSKIDDVPTQVDGVTIEWETSDPSIMKFEHRGNLLSVTQFPGATDKKATITAKLKYLDLTAEKKFEVIVLNNKSELDGLTGCDVAEAYYLRGLPFNSYTMQVFVPNESTYNVGTVPVTFTVTDVKGPQQNVFGVKDGYYIRRSLKDADITVSYSISCKGQNKNNVNQNVKVPKITEYTRKAKIGAAQAEITQLVTFYPSYFEVLNQGLFINGTRYKYTVTNDAGIMDIEETAYYDIDKWVTREDEKKKALNDDKAYFNALKDFEKNPTFDGYKVFLGKTKKDEADRYDVYTVIHLGGFMDPKLTIIDRQDSESKKKDAETINKFNNCSIEQKNAAAKKYLEQQKNDKLPSKEGKQLTIDEYLSVFEEKYSEVYDKLFPPFKSTVGFNVSNVSNVPNVSNKGKLIISSSYDVNKKWYEQYGAYVNKAPASRNYYFEKLSIFNVEQKLGILHKKNPNVYFAEGVVIEFTDDKFENFKVVESGFKGQTGTVTWNELSKTVTVSMTINGQEISYPLVYTNYDILN